MWVDCDDREAEVLAKRMVTYLTSLGAINIQVVKTEQMIPPLTDK